MRHPNVDDQVRLTCDVPQLELHRGEVGVVRSTWFGPGLNYEVEFRPPGCDLDTRAVLSAGQVEVHDASIDVRR